MSDGYCGAEDFCVLAGQSWSIREAAQLAIAGDAEELRKPTYLLSIEPALDALRDCERECCSIHVDCGEARELLAAIDAEYEAINAEAAQ